MIESVPFQSAKNILLIEQKRLEILSSLGYKYGKMCNRLIWNVDQCLYSLDMHGVLSYIIDKVFLPLNSDSGIPISIYIYISTSMMIEDDALKQQQKIIRIIY